MTDLVVELRTGRGVNEGPMRDAWVHAKMQEAAARIERLEAALRENRALVLEEAAKVADVMSANWRKARVVCLADDIWLKGLSDGADDVSVAIRALKEGE